MTTPILFQTVADAKNNKLGIVILNRPQALNALNKAMFLQLHAQLKAWQSDDSIKAVLIKSAVEKAFCAGGDIRAIYENKNEGIDVLASYFQVEYDVNKIIYHYSKPIIALLQGITMGGGVGISVHASHCVAAENLRWAMPETLIGFFPDVGASYYLSRLPHHIGTYLALTGASITSNEAHSLNLIKAIVPLSNFDALEKKLSETIYTKNDSDTVSKIIAEFETPLTHTIEFPFKKNIAACFDKVTIEGIVTSLEKNNSEWSAEILEKLKLRSPTSLKVSLYQLQRAKDENFDHVIAMDFHIAKVMLENPDFYEGVRAAIIDKDKKPQWQPSKIAMVSSETVETYFL